MRKLFFDHNECDHNSSEIGGKAKGLYHLLQLGLNVPEFIVIPIANIDRLEEAVDQFVTTHNVRNKKYAVRSSAIAEDGAEQSYAGIFESQLNVKVEDLKSTAIRIVNAIHRSEVYRKHLDNKNDIDLGVAVIIQKMINPDQSGVAFSIDPVTYEHKHIINACNGYGDKLVSGKIDGEQYAVKLDSISKTTRTEENPVLNKEQILELSSILDKLSDHFDHPVDIEFGYENSQLNLLQVRPITAIPSGTYTVYDNSNIVESYPGVTTPLTFSFINMVYTRVYKQFTQLMGVRKSEISDNEHVFQNTLGLVKGRVYYNLLNWYKMLAMAPGFSVNARYMETMMGVKERFELKEQYQLNKTIAKVRVVFMALNILRIQFGIKSRTKQFIRRLNKILKETNHKKLDRYSFDELRTDFLKFEERLILQWKAPLINDFFSMIWFGVLKKLCEKHFPEHDNLHNDLLCGSKDIISTQPMEESLKIVSAIQVDPKWMGYFKTRDDESIVKIVETEINDPISLAIKSFIERFGDRCIGELKLESISYRNDPKLLIRLLRSYLKEGLNTDIFNNFSNDKIRKQAEHVVNAKLPSYSFRKMIFSRVLKNARYLVSNRENLRYERTRVFGYVREYFIQMGKRLANTKIIENARDIFFLEHDEILSIELNKDTTWIKECIVKRKEQFASYRNDPAPSDRFFTYDDDFSDHYIYAANSFDDFDGQLSGIGCSPGEISAEVMIVDDPEATDSIEGKIMIARSTDPGWVKLFPSSAGIIVEKGSLLSHTSIVAREMGIPCIVGVDHLLNTLKPGDHIKMNGRSGKIEIVDPNE